MGAADCRDLREKTPRLPVRHEPDELREIDASIAGQTMSGIAYSPGLGGLFRLRAAKTLPDTVAHRALPYAMIDHDRLRAAILAQLSADLEIQLRAAHLARDEAISDESKAENKYDTRAQEAAYLAQGQARQAGEIIENISAFRNLPAPPVAPPAALGHVLRLASGNRLIDYVLGPRAGGLEIQLDSRTVTVVTLTSPLGRQLLGSRVGDTVSLPGRVKATAYTVMAIE